MRQIIAVSLLLMAAAPCFARDETTWITDRSVLDCSPSTLSSSGALTLRLGPAHGKELAIRRMSDNAWFFLAVESPPVDWSLLMSPKAFQTATHVEIPASYKAPKWDSQNIEEPIFSSSGIYYVYASENLESEAGGARCMVKYRAHGP